MTKKLIINRLSDDGFQTLGTFAVMNLSETELAGYTLELPFKDNQRSISCIPKGIYQVKKRDSTSSASFNYEHFILLDVPNRDYILIHAANYKRQLRGCIGVGEKQIDIDNDGKKDITNSRKTLAKLIEILPDSFELEIG